MISKEYVSRLIKSIDTRKSKTSGTSGNKNCTVTQIDIDLYGMENILDTLAYMEQQMPKGMISIKWEFYGGRRADVKKFSIRKEAIEDLYKLIGETSSRESLENAKTQITQQRDKCIIPWLKNGYYFDRLKQIERGTIPADIDDIEFDRALNLVCGNTDPVYMRIFSSQNHFRDSKIFEQQYRSKICRIIKKYCPDIYDTDGETDYESENDLLRRFNILSYNTTFECKGPAEYILGQQLFSTKGHTSGVVFNTDTVIKMSFVGLPGVKRIVTIENKANLYATQYRDDTLYIYVHGFLSPLEVSLCKRIEMLAGDEVTYQHWGDLDYGGIQIYSFLKRNVFVKMQPLHMDVSAYEEYERRSKGYLLHPSVLKKLKTLEIPEMEGLKEKLLETGVGFEQESILEW